MALWHFFSIFTLWIKRKTFFVNWRKPFQYQTYAIYNFAEIVEVIEGNQTAPIRYSFPYFSRWQMTQSLQDEKDGHFSSVDQD